MGLNNLIDRLNEELNKIKNSTNYDSSYFTSDEHFNDDLSSVLNTESSVTDDTKENISEEANEAIEHNESICDEQSNEEQNTDNSYPDIEPDDDTKSLVTIKENRLLTAQTMFKKSVRMSLKAFLLSVSLSFLNLFI